MTTETILAALTLAVAVAVLIVLLARKGVDAEKLRRDAVKELSERQDAALASLRGELLGEIRATRAEVNTAVQGSMRLISDNLTAAQKQSSEMQDARLRELIETEKSGQTLLLNTVSERLGRVDAQVKAFAEENKQSLEGIRATVQTRLEAMQQDNSAQLEKMRATVDEKLQKTLDERITQSFKLVNDRLQEVYTGLGEMKTLASGVGDLKKVLSNVKTRGILGELQLGAIIEELLPREQYEENVATKKGSTNRVEYAIKLPGQTEGSVVYLPIDAKFPADIYQALVDAYDSGDTALIQSAGAMLETRIKGCAKDIRDKYISPPDTTDFAIMFLPFEGLYAEVVRRGLVDVLQRQYKVNIAGPTTFAALLNSLQMGFRTLAIQKRSGEVWNVLGAVKTEFAAFEDVLETAQKRIEQTSAELDKLVGVRTRKINSKLRAVSELPSYEAQQMIDSAPADDTE